MVHNIELVAPIDCIFPHLNDIGKLIFRLIGLVCIYLLRLIVDIDFIFVADKCLRVIHICLIIAIYNSLAVLIYICLRSISYFDFAAIL